MSLFDLQDVCMVIGSLETLDLPMVVDLIGIFVLKGPYCTLTMTDLFLQALSVIPRGSWGDVARRFTMIRWVSPKMWFQSRKCCEPTASCIPEPLRVTQGPNCYFGLGAPKNCFYIIILSFVNYVDRSDLIVDRDYDEVTGPRVSIEYNTITLDFFLSSPHSPHAAAASLPSPPASDAPPPPSDLFRPSRRGDSVHEIFVVFYSVDRRRNRESSHAHPSGSCGNRAHMMCTVVRTCCARWSALAAHTGRTPCAHVAHDSARTSRTAAAPPTQTGRAGGRPPSAHAAHGGAPPVRQFRAEMRRLFLNSWVFSCLSRAARRVSGQ
ncbi:hypothetical protein F511_03544 [Dorcoceras hygrometricum]|uniref:Uncharacterized protein n=1 Tax=Dorcoceras hygrometricum TaxID=472368 RepID=A0A2Z7BXA4_9LAMI|nr:hypothetical protein F511_03544 [Dorcoceras hygrometricum]